MVRRGRPHNQSWHARRFDQREGPFDLVLEEINTLPFLSCVWAPERSVLLMQQLAREVWFYEAIWGLSLVGYLVEPLYLRLYRHQPALALSESTRDDLVRLGYDRSKIGLLAGATDAIPTGRARLARRPGRAGDRTLSFLFVGRLTPSKRVHDILTAFSEARRQLRAHGIAVKLRVIGSGNASYERRLRVLARRLSIGEAVEFHGWVNKWWLNDQVADSDVLVMASAREGWGLVVTEANAVGIPAIGYPVPGLRDSIRNGITGLLTATPEPRALAIEMVRIASNPDLLDRLSRASQEDAGFRNWDASGRAAITGLARASLQLRQSVRHTDQLDSQSGASAVERALHKHLEVVKSQR